MERKIFCDKCYENEMHWLIMFITALCYFSYETSMVEEQESLQLILLESLPLTNTVNFFSICSILLEDASFCQQNAQLKNRLFCSKFIQSRSRLHLNRPALRADPLLLLGSLNIVHYCQYYELFLENKFFREEKYTLGRKRLFRLFLTCKSHILHK